MTSFETPFCGEPFKLGLDRGQVRLELAVLAHDRVIPVAVRRGVVIEDDGFTAVFETRGLNGVAKKVRGRHQVTAGRFQPSDCLLKPPCRRSEQPRPWQSSSTEPYRSIKGVARQ